MTVPIIYEDDQLFAVDKPAGLSVHKTHPQDPNETLADILVRERPYLARVGEDPLRPGIVHRLDKETSGVIVVAKTQGAFVKIKAQFQERSVLKEYAALVYGRPEKRTGSIDLPLGKVGTRQTTQVEGRRELVVRDARTEYVVEKTFKDYSLLRVHPQTGRTHQIRVHLKAIGHPVVGDPEYAPSELQALSAKLGLKRMFLHAEKLELTSPAGPRLTLEAPLPEALQKVLNMLESSDVVRH